MFPSFDLQSNTHILFLSLQIDQKDFLTNIYHLKGLSLAAHQIRIEKSNVYRITYLVVLSLSFRGTKPNLYSSRSRYFRCWHLFLIFKDRGVLFHISWHDIWLFLIFRLYQRFSAQFVPFASSQEFSYVY